jgi:hypothetical protein
MSSAQGHLGALLGLSGIWLATLVCPTSLSSLSNSPWIRGAPCVESGVDIEKSNSIFSEIASPLWMKALRAVPRINFA